MEEIDSADNLAQIIHGLLSLERKEKHSQACRNMHRNIRNSHLDIFSILPQKIRGNLADLFAWQCSFQDRTARRRCRYPADLGVKYEETQKNSKKQETELYVQVAEKPENQKENVRRSTCLFPAFMSDGILW